MAAARCPWRHSPHGARRELREYEDVIDTARDGFGVDRSSVSRPFVRAAAVDVRALVEWRFDGERYASMILPLYMGLFEFVHNVRARGKRLLGALIAQLLAPPRNPS